MGTKLFFGGLAWATTDASLRAACERFGEVVEATVVIDRATGRSKGFGFVTFATEEAANRARAELDGSMLDGRTIKVDEPRPREDRGPRGGGYSGGGYSGGGHSGGRGGDRGYHGSDHYDTGFEDRGSRGRDRGHDRDRGGRF